MERNELVKKILKLMGEDVLREEQIKEIKEEMDIEELKELLKVLEVLGYEDEEAKALNKLLQESEKQLKDKFENAE